MREWEKKQQPTKKISNENYRNIAICWKESALPFLSLRFEASICYPPEKSNSFDCYLKHTALKTYWAKAMAWTSNKTQQNT